MMISAATGFMLPLLTSEPMPPMAPGRPDTMPEKMISEMPLPRPRSVICSPSHIRNIVPVTSEMTATTRNMKPGSETRLPWDSSATEMPSAWNVASASVAHRVYLVMMRRPASPSFLI